MEVEDTRKRNLETGKVYEYGEDIVMVILDQLPTGTCYAIVSLLSGSVQSKWHESLAKLSYEFELLPPVNVKLLIK